MQWTWPRALHGTDSIPHPTTWAGVCVCGGGGCAQNNVSDPRYGWLCTSFINTGICWLRHSTNCDVPV